MRFRYFDSAGNEVSLSTAAALAVKIDLGEVTETTLLYDAACDEWAPAGKQEIYRHIVEHGASAADDVAPGDAVEAAEEPSTDAALPDPALPDPEPSSPGSPDRSRGVPLEDFWGPAMSASEAKAREAAAEFDLSLDELTTGKGADDRSGSSDDERDGLSLEPSKDASGDAPAEAPEPRAEGGSPVGASGGTGDEPDSGAERPASDTAPPSTPAGEPPVAERPAAAPSSGESGAPSSGKSAAGGTPPRRSRSRDASLARLEKIAREAAAKMEREEAARKRGPGPTLGDRVADGARRGGQKTGEALKTGATASARALSEGGKATAETVGAGMRALGKRVRKAGPKIRRGLAGLARKSGSGASGLAALARSAGRGIGAGAAAAARGAGAAVGFTARVLKAAFVAPFRATAGVWRMLDPVRGRAARDARKVLGTGVQRFRRAVFSPLALGLGLFVAIFLFFTYGGGREAGEELWQATVGIARSVAAEADEETAPEGEPAEPAEGVVSADAGAVPGGGPEEVALTDTGTEEGAPAAGAADSVLAADAVLTTEDSALAAPPLDQALLAEFEREVTLASEGALRDMIAAMDSVERAYELPEAPPEEWLGGYYLSHATEFHDVRQYWARYRGYIRSVKAQDGVLYRRGLEARFEELDVPREQVARLTALAERRFREGRLHRDSLYDAMAAVAEAAVDLHDFLAENQDSIEYDPVRPGRVSRAPVLEAYATSPGVKAEMDARLDRTLETMERVHGLRPVFTRELQDVLFSSLQAAAAVDTFRMGPRETLPDSGAAPPPDSGAAAPRGAGDPPPHSGGRRPGG